MYKFSIYLTLQFVCVVLILQSCYDQIELPEYPLESPVIYTPCDKNSLEAVDHYLDTTWNAQRVHRFIRGTWRLYAAQSMQTDTVKLLGPTFETELRFTDTTIEVYEPYNVLKGSGEYIVEPKGIANSKIYGLNIISDEVSASAYSIGSLIPCNSDLIIYRSNLDGIDKFFRKVE